MDLIDRNMQAPGRLPLSRQELGRQFLSGFSIDSLPNYWVKVLGKPASISVGKEN
mgnify:CR=1 FL=1